MKNLDLINRLRGGVYGINRIALCAEAADELLRQNAQLDEAMVALKKAYPQLMGNAEKAVREAILRIEGFDVKTGQYIVLRSRESSRKGSE